MERKFLAFDLETSKEAPIAQWKEHRPLGIACAAILASDTDNLMQWYGRAPDGSPNSRMNRDEVQAMVRTMSALVEAGGYTIVTWNGLGFDFDILAEESGMSEDCIRLALGHADMMFHILCERGFGVSLDAVARGMDVPGKKEGITGGEVPTLWASGQYQKVLDYLAQDVRTTVDLALAATERGHLAWTSRNGNDQRIGLPEGLLTTEDAQHLPEPDTSWMSNPDQWSRQRYTEWCRYPGTS
jgi:hypothetical protein